MLLLLLLLLLLPAAATATDTAIATRLPPQPPGWSPTTQVQSLVDFWSSSSDCIVGLTAPPLFLALQVDRFHRNNGRVTKRHDTIEVNHQIVVPIFSGADLAVEVSWYKLNATISHAGLHPSTGHYTACLVQGTSVWSCDDNRHAHRSDSFPKLHDKECYVLLYQRCAAI